MLVCSVLRVLCTECMTSPRRQAPAGRPAEFLRRRVPAFGWPALAVSAGRAAARRGELLREEKDEGKRGGDAAGVAGRVRREATIGTITEASPFQPLPPPTAPPLAMSRCAAGSHPLASSRRQWQGAGARNNYLQPRKRGTGRRRWERGNWARDLLRRTER